MSVDGGSAFRDHVVKRVIVYLKHKHKVTEHVAYKEVDPPWVITYAFGIAVVLLWLGIILHNVLKCTETDPLPLYDKVVIGHLMLMKLVLNVCVWLLQKMMIIGDFAFDELIKSINTTQ